MKNCECSYLSIIAGIIFGVIVGVLSYFGFTDALTAFIIYIAIGAAGVFFTPLYTLLAFIAEHGHSECAKGRITALFSAAALVSSGAGLIISRADSLIATAMILAIATFFAVTLIGIVICTRK